MEKNDVLILADAITGLMMDPEKVLINHDGNPYAFIGITNDGKNIIVSAYKVYEDTNVKILGELSNEKIEMDPGDFGYSIMTKEKAQKLHNEYFEFVPCYEDIYAID